jgi:hypothetical protein
VGSRFKPTNPIPQKGVGFFHERFNMPIIKIDNKDYDTGTLSTEAEQQLQMLSVTEQEINLLQAQLAITQTIYSLSAAPN